MLKITNLEVKVEDKQILNGMKIFGRPDIAGHKLMMHLMILIERWKDVEEAMDYIEKEIIKVVDE